MKVKKKFWEMPWDCEAWTTSPTRLGMTLAARGLYFEMLNYQWVEGSVPDNPQMVAALCGVPLPEVEANWEAVRGRFRALKNGTIRNARMEKIRRFKIGLHGSKNGLHNALHDKRKKAANIRWEKQRSYDALAMQTAANERTTNDITSNDITSNEEESANAGRAREEAPYDFNGYDPGEDFRRFWREASKRAPDRLPPFVEMERVFATVVRTPEIAAKVFAGFEACDKGRDWQEGVYRNWGAWITGLWFERAPLPAKPKQEKESLLERMKRL